METMVCKKFTNSIYLNDCFTNKQKYKTKKSIKTIKTCRAEKKNDVRKVEF
jgi:hypothetical protein